MFLTSEVAPQHGELAALLSALRVADDHSRFGATIGAGIVRGQVGAPDDFVCVGQGLRFRRARSDREQRGDDRDAIGKVSVTHKSSPQSPLVASPATAGAGNNLGPSHDITAGSRTSVENPEMAMIEAMKAPTVM